jgi:monoamine oxidase
MKIIIIGAGISGLSAAKELIQHGIDVIILEARERIGGRIWKADNFDIPIDLGASWIHQMNGNPLTKIANELKLHIDSTCNPYLTAEGSFELYDYDGQPFKDSKLETVTRQKFNSLIEKGIEILGNMDTDISIEEMFRITQMEHRFHDEEHPHLMKWLRAGIEGWENADLCSISARNHFCEIENPEFTGGDGFIVSGFFNIIQELAKDLLKENRILLSHVVKKIQYNNRYVKIETNRGKFYADYVISTLPLGVLQNDLVIFDPPLPEHKRIVIHKIGFGVMNKLILQFSECFWNPNCDGIGFLSKKHGKFNFFLNLTPLLKKPILMCFVAAEFAQKIESWTDEQIIQKIMKILNKIFGKEKKVPEPINYKFTRWYTDPYSRGSYSYMKVGSTFSDIEILAEPVGRVLFAGEATFVYPGYTHGGYLSGQREAKRIINYIKDMEGIEQEKNEKNEKKIYY